jgi:hypothetical protein
MEIIESNPNNVYIQLAAVEPYFTDFEFANRPTDFMKRVDVDQFKLDSNIYKDGKKAPSRRLQMHEIGCDTTIFILVSFFL